MSMPVSVSLDSAVEPRSRSCLKDEQGFKVAYKWVFTIKFYLPGVILCHQFPPTEVGTFAQMAPGHSETLTRAMFEMDLWNAVSQKPS